MCYNQASILCEVHIIECVCVCVCVNPPHLLNLTGSLTNSMTRSAATVRYCCLVAVHVHVCVREKEKEREREKERG